MLTKVNRSTVQKANSSLIVIWKLTSNGIKKEIKSNLANVFSPPTPPPLTIPFQAAKILANYLGGQYSPLTRSLVAVKVEDPSRGYDMMSSQSGMEKKVIKYG